MLVIYASGDRSGNQFVAASMLIASAEEHGVPYYYTRFKPANTIKHLNGGLHCLRSFTGKSDLFLRLCNRVRHLPPCLLKLFRLDFWYEPKGLVEQYVEKFIRAASDNKIHMWDMWLYTDFKALLKHQDEVRRRLSLKDEYTAAAQRVAAKARTADSILVGVHIRRTDYKEWQGGRLYFSTSQYREWMQQCVQASPKPVHFIICSDERFDEAAFSEGFEHVTFSHENVVTDMAVLSLCDYIIGPPSTFSGFASFLGKTPKFSLNGTDSRISSLEQFRIYLLEYTDLFSERNEDGHISTFGPNRCIKIQDGELGEPVELMQDIDCAGRSHTISAAE